MLLSAVRASDQSQSAYRCIGNIRGRDMREEDSPVEHAPSVTANWLVLAGALLIAASMWIAWVSYGIFAVHRQVAAEVAASVMPASGEKPSSGANSLSADERRALRFSEIGQVGDSFGGLNTALTAIAGALVFWAGFMQHQALKHAREQASTERLARQKQAADTLRAVEIAERTAKSAEEANRLARDSYIATQRAWIRVEISPGGPLIYDVNGLNLTFDVRLTNVGNSPALNVFPHIQLEAPAVGISVDFNEREIARKISEQQRSQPVLPFGFTIFPNESIVQKMTALISKDEVNRLTKKFPAIYIKLFCVTQYRLVIEDGIWHQTASVHEVRRADVGRPEAKAQNRSQEAIFVDEGVVPMEQIRLMGSLVFPGHAD